MSQNSSTTGAEQAVVSATSPGTHSRKRKVRNLLINRRFQLKWVSLILLVTFALFATLGGYIWELERHSSDAIVNGLSAMYGAEEVEVMKELFVASDSNVLWVLMGSGVALILTLAGFGVVLTHKMAGPIYALRKSMGRVADGQWFNVRGVRDGDEFQGLASSWREVIGTICTKERAELEQLEKIIEMDGAPENVKSALKIVAAEKRAYLG